MRADGHRIGTVIAVSAGAVVARYPPHGAGRGLVGDRSEIRVGALHVGGPGDEHRLAVRADGHRPGLGHAARAVVAPGPQPGAGGGLVADRGKLMRLAPGQCAVPGDEHPLAVRADRHRGGVVLRAGRAVVVPDPQPAARGSRPRRRPGHLRGRGGRTRRARAAGSRRAQRSTRHHSNPAGNGLIHRTSSLAAHPRRRHGPSRGNRPPPVIAQKRPRVRSAARTHLA